MENAIPLEKFSKGKKGRQIRSAKAMNDVVNGLPRNQDWLVKLPQGAGNAYFLWSKSDKENVVLDLSGVSTLIIEDLTVYDEDETTILHTGKTRKFWTVDNGGTKKEVFIFKESICIDNETKHIYAERTKSFE